MLLHAEVDSWQESVATPKTTARLNTLWNLVSDLEPENREPEAFSFEAYAALVWHPPPLCLSDNWSPASEG